jgi:hypothetical protein
MRCPATEYSVDHSPEDYSMADYSAVDYLVAENSVEGYLVDL